MQGKRQLLEPTPYSSKFRFWFHRQVQNVWEKTDNGQGINMNTAEVEIKTHTIMRPSILKSFCSNSQIWIRAFCSDSYKKKKTKKNQQSTYRNRICDQISSKVKRPSWLTLWRNLKMRFWSHRPCINPKNQKSGISDGNNEQSSTSSKRAPTHTIYKNIYMIREGGDREYDGLCHDPLDFGGRHGCYLGRSQSRLLQKTLMKENPRRDWWDFGNSILFSV